MAEKTKDEQAEQWDGDTAQVKESVAGSAEKAADKVEEVKASARGRAPDIGEHDSDAPGDQGSGGDAGSGPTGGIEPEEISQPDRRPALMSGAAFALGLVAGLLIGWWVSD
jgi:hypothetical protein